MTTDLQTRFPNLGIQINLDMAFLGLPQEVLERYELDFTLSPEEARAHARELIRYIALCKLNPAARYGMAGQIDQLWHVFILHTQAYAAWCETHLGEFFHHRPSTLADKAEVVAGTQPNTYALFYRDYQLHFGLLPPTIWPTPHQRVDCNNCSSCQSCGGGGTKKKGR